MANRITRLYRELFGEGGPAARVTRLFRETFSEGAPAARVTRLFQELFADNPVVVLSPFKAAQRDDELPLEEDCFDYDGDNPDSSPIIALFPPAVFTFIGSSDEELPDFEDRFDYDGDNSPLVRRRRRIPGKVFFAT